MIKFFDGAFGTYYLTKTNDYTPCERANITNKDMVLSIHNEYIKSGVNAIKTNTFGANNSNFNNPDELKQIITEGYNIALQATQGTNVKVFADIGHIDGDDASNQYMQIVNIFINLGAANFLFETLCESKAIKPAIDIIKQRVQNSTVMVSFAVSQDGYSSMGLYYKSLINEAIQNIDVDIVGLNCVCGPAHLLNLTKQLGRITKPLAIMPNAGYPSSINGRTVFQDNAEYFALKLSQLNETGADILGGCCGTTPNHIALAIKNITSKNVTDAKPLHNIKSQTKDTESNCQKTDKFPLKPIFVELDPPIDTDCDFILSAVDKLKRCGVTTITIADSPLAKARADSIATAAKIKRDKNIDVLPHLTCRDKNHIAIKGSLLGAGFDGINKILVVTGDAIACDSYYKKSGVFNFNSIQLMAYINSLNSEVFIGNPFSIGGAINVNAANFEKELERSGEKIKSGAEFLLSQSIFTDRAIENFKKAKQQLNCKLYAGILPVASYKNAVFLNNEVKGIDIPQQIIDNLKDKEVDDVFNISINFSMDIINEVYDCADGFYIMTPLKKIDLVCDLIKGCFDV